MISISPRIAGTAVLVLSTTTVHAQWHDETPAVSPAPRYGAAMTSTANTGGLLLFGGTVPALVVTAETWFYNGGAWTRLSPPTSPPPRWNTSAVFDSARGVVVLYGGNGSAMPFTAIHLADTWEWNGSTWTGIAPSGSPGPRHGHAACFDSARNRTVLFGGMNGFSSFATGTWEYDGATWSLVPTTGTPGSRSGPAACFHAGVNRLERWLLRWKPDRDTSARQVG